MVLAGSFAASLALNALVGLPVFALLGWYLQGTRDAQDKPVRVVSISSAQWEKNLRTTGPRHPAAAKVDPARPSADRSKVGPKVEEPKKPEVERPEPLEKLSGRVVEVPPTPDDSPNRDAKYLSKYNTHVEKETTARSEDVDLKNKRVANKRSHVDSPTPPEAALASPNLSLKGNGGKELAGADKPGQSEAARRRFLFEMPDLMRRDAVHLSPGAGAGIGAHVADRTGSEAMRGNSSQFRLQLGSGDEDKEAEAGAGRKGAADGSDDRKPLPTIAAVAPAMGVPGKVSGAPHDHVDGLPEGDGTFLNTKEFKYATFLYRVRDSVASYWEGFVANEYRRRDPTGNVYGTRDRSTVLHVELSREGRLADVRVEQTSGVDFLDHVAIEAFKKAEPFPNPPAGLVEEDGAIRFNFQFVVTMTSHGFNVFRFQ